MNTAYSQNCRPILYLNDCSNLTKNLNNSELFQQLCPSTKYTFIADRVKESLEVKNPEGIYTHSLWGESIKKLSQELVDPKKKLQQLFEKNSIERIEGNVPINEAEILLLDDTCHGNVEQTLIRGEIANCLRNESNIFLCEGYGSEKMRFTANEIHQALAPNIELNFAKDIYSGWDDSLVYKQSQEKIQLSLQSINIIQSKASDGKASKESLKFLLQAVQDIQIVTGSEAHKRTESQWNTIKKFKDTFPDLKIILFAGAAHNHEKWLLEKMSQYKYCLITPKKCETAENKFDAMKYYEVDKHGIWNNRKQQ